MVCFHDDPEKFNTPVALKRLEEEVCVLIEVMLILHCAPKLLVHLKLKMLNPITLLCCVFQMERCTELDRKILEMDEKFLVNPAFIKKQQCGTTEEDIALAPAMSGQGSSTFTM